MICKGCGVNIVYNTDKCPLCGRDFSHEEKEELKVFPKTHPINQKEIKPIISFSTLFFIVGLIAIIPIAITNGFIGEHPWSVSVVLAILFAFFLLRYTFFDWCSVAFNLTTNALSASAFFLALQFGAKVDFPALPYLLPAIFFVAMVVLTILNIIKKKGNKQGSYGLALLFYLLLLGQFFSNLFLNSANYFNVVVTLISTIYIFIVIFVKGREIYRELKTFFAI